MQTYECCKFVYQIVYIYCRINEFSASNPLMSVGGSIPGRKNYHYLSKVNAVPEEQNYLQKLISLFLLRRNFGVKISQNIPFCTIRYQINNSWSFTALVTNLTRSLPQPYCKTWCLSLIYSGRLLPN